LDRQLAIALLVYIEPVTDSKPEKTAKPIDEIYCWGKGFWHREKNATKSEA
jgi:hypothetical protein